MRLKQQICRFVLLFPICLLYLSSTPYSQTPHFEQPWFNNDLPSQQIFSIYQDQRGCLWLATAEGICRFDGKNLNTYQVNQNEAKNYIFNFFEYSPHAVWINTGLNKLYFFDPLSTPVKFTPFAFNEQLIQVFENEVYDLIRKIWTDGEYLYASFLYSSGYIKISSSGFTQVFGRANTGNTVDIYDADVEVKFKNRKSEKFIISSFTKSDSTKIYLHISDSASQTNTTTNVVHSYKERNSTGIADYAFSSESTLFIISNQWFTVCDTGCRVISLPSNGTCLEIYNDQVLIGTYDGIYHYTQAGEFIAHYLEKRTIHKILTDSDSAIWVGTSEEGLYYCRSFKHLVFPPLLNRRKAPKDIIVQKDWFGLLSENKTLDIYSRNADLIEQFDDVYFYQNIYNSKDKNLSQYLGEAKYYLEGRTYNYFGLERESDSFCIQTLQKSIFIFTKDSYIAIKKTVLPKINGHHVLNDSVILLPTNKGVYELINFNYIRPFAFTWTVRDWQINSITPFRDGYLMRCPTKGILFLSEKETLLFNTESGLLSNETLSLEVVNDTLIWIASTEGITAIELSTENKLSLHHHTDESGLNETKINGFEHYNDSIWVSTRSGVCLFPASALLTDNILNPQHFSIDSVYLNEENVKPLNDTVLVNYGSILTIYFNQICLGSSRPINYRFNFSDNPGIWHETKTNNIQHVCQSVGYQTVIIKSSLPGFIGSPEIRLVIFTRTPYWQQWWFFALIVFAVAAMTGIVVRIALHMQESRRMREVEKLKLEMKALVSQMNPHFTFNSINSIQAYIINNERREAVAYLTEFALLIRKTLEYTSLEYITLAQEIAFLEIYASLEKKRFEFTFDLEINLALVSAIDKFFIPPLLLQPLLENAIIHGLAKQKDGARKIILNFTESSDYLIITVSDSGPGFNPAETKRHASFGLKILQQRVQIHNGKSFQPHDFEIKTSDATNNSTSVVLRLINKYTN